MTDRTDLLARPASWSSTSPPGCTSHDVVARLRRILRTRKVGHAGTLDPMATGVLVCGVERGTKLLGHLALDTKAYTATIRLGATTTTDDAEGETVTTTDPSARRPTPAIAAGDRRADRPDPAGAQLGQRDQGRRAAGVRAGAGGGAGRAAAAAGHGLGVRRCCARRGADLDVAVECSSGTYVRALARDLGAALGVGGHLTALRRTRVGPFRLEHARTLGSWRPRRRFPAAGRGRGGRRSRGGTSTPTQATDLAHGRPLPAAGVAGTYGVFAPDGRVLALVAERDGAARPVVVLAPAGG